MKTIQHPWGVCFSCRQNLPLFPETGMCGPCTTGDASTLLEDSHVVDDHASNGRDFLDARRSTTGNETNETFRAMKADRKARLDAEEPRRLAKMHTVCTKLGVGVRALTQWQFRLTYKDRWVDYCPRTRKVTYGRDSVGVGLHEALVFLDVPDGEGANE